MGTYIIFNMHIDKVQGRINFSKKMNLSIFRFVMFSHYRIPRENLLNKTGDVTPEGNYESVFSEPTKILGAALESFSAGRLGIMQVIYD